MLESEDKLIKQAQKGGAEYFGQLYDHYMPKIYRYILFKVSSRQETEDLTHEVFVSAWEKLGGYRSKGFPFSSWLYNIARNKVIDYYRTKKSHLSLENLDPDFFKVVGAVEKNIDVALDFSQVKTAMNQLSDDSQDVLIMKFVDDLSHREIAEAMDKSEGAVRLMQHRAIQNLKEILSINSTKLRVDPESEIEGLKNGRPNN